jgi:hypothetical protein
MDLATYAAQRAALGVKDTGDFVGLNSGGFPEAANSALSAEQRHQLGLATTHEWAVEPGVPRGIPASAMPESIGGLPMRGTVSPKNNS